MSCCCACARMRRVRGCCCTRLREEVVRGAGLQQVGARGHAAERERAVGLRQRRHLSPVGRVQPDDDGAHACARARARCRAQDRVRLRACACATAQCTAPCSQPPGDSTAPCSTPSASSHAACRASRGSRQHSRAAAVLRWWCMVVPDAAAAAQRGSGIGCVLAQDDRGTWRVCAMEPARARRLKWPDAWASSSAAAG